MISPFIKPFEIHKIFQYDTRHITLFTAVSRSFASDIIRRSIMTSRKAKHFRAIFARNFLKIHTFSMKYWYFLELSCDKKNLKWIFISDPIYGYFYFYDSCWASIQCTELCNFHRCCCKMSPQIILEPTLWNTNTSSFYIYFYLVTGCNPNDLDIWTDWCRLGLQFVVYKSAEQEWSFVN